MNWRWTAQRLLVSAFLILHLGATTLWVMPTCPIRNRTVDLVRYYMVPLGLWQYWTMFAPDPAKIIFTLEAEVIDTQGLRYNFAFPRLAGYTPFEALPRFRYPKYAANLTIDDLHLAREFGARHVARSLGLGADRYPLEVRLFYQVKDMPPPGSPALDPLAPTRNTLLGSYSFASLSEVRP